MNPRDIISHKISLKLTLLKLKYLKNKNGRQKVGNNDISDL